MQSVLTAALESGISTLFFPQSDVHLAKEWRQLARFTAICAEDGLLHSMGTPDDSIDPEKVSSLHYLSPLVPSVLFLLMQKIKLQPKCTLT